MPLPFLIGVAVGAGAVLAYNKSDKVKTKTDEIVGKSKEFANETLTKTKKNVSELKDNLCSKKETKEKIEKEEK
ncbi:conserved hypothetical protein [Arcobacter nitrofigilis DSM 7299]|uniref:YtxH domain-containing protein n=1 Tax=Arcobacter nitrofigilis (strain ATCC 33309 / DSM 7299 / CCUG 15893 / LMG 7604 / NCTC 12251 / CI) TaxID=572480 RepID=D5V6Q5_ARCNC|nr:hypothetical protein [Arcobacter nitrofigilis]ADG94325.1 conserved hypothetical protein [Arcobacter nitrofigilis DSM 7299]